MKKNIFLYLFVFAALIALFLLMKGNKTLETSNAAIAKIEGYSHHNKDSIHPY